MIESYIWYFAISAIFVIVFILFLFFGTKKYKAYDFFEDEKEYINHLNIICPSIDREENHSKTTYYIDVDLCNFDDLKKSLLLEYIDKKIYIVKTDELDRFIVLKDDDFDAQNTYIDLHLAKDKYVLELNNLENPSFLHTINSQYMQ